MPPPGTKQKDPNADPNDEGKASLDEAIMVKADEHCIDCQNYEVSSGRCHKVVGFHAPEDACKNIFQALKDDDGDDEAAVGEPPQGGADEAQEQGQ